MENRETESVKRGGSGIDWTKYLKGKVVAKHPVNRENVIDTSQNQYTSQMREV